MLLTLAACTVEVSLGYAPTVPIDRLGPPRIASVAASDERGYDADAYWLGTIRGGFGNPLKFMTSDRSVSDTVADAVQQALALRGMMGASDAPATLAVTIERLGADQLLRREASVALVLVLRRGSDGAALYRDRAEIMLSGGSVLSPEIGLFGSAERLRALLERALDRTIDQAVDRPGFRAALLETRPVPAAHGPSPDPSTD